jgi:transposase
MFSLTPSMRYYLYSLPTDMRRRFLHPERHGDQPDGAQRAGRRRVHLCQPRRVTSMKALHMECGGLVIYHMKLESGRFKLPVFDPGTNTCPTDWQGLVAMVQGLPGTKKRGLEKRWKNPCNP